MLKVRQTFNLQHSTFNPGKTSQKPPNSPISTLNLNLNHYTGFYKEYVSDTPQKIRADMGKIACVYPNILLTIG